MLGTTINYTYFTRMDIICNALILLTVVTGDNDTVKIRYQSSCTCHSPRHNNLKGHKTFFTCFSEKSMCTDLHQIRFLDLSHRCDKVAHFCNH